MSEIDFDVTDATGRKINLSSLELPSPYTTANYGNILFKDTGTYGNYVNLYLVEVQDMNNPSNYDPMLAIDQSLWVEKDIQAYGALMTNSDPNKGYGGGAVLIGHGFERDANNPPADPPRIDLSDSGYQELYITAGTSVGKTNGAGDILANIRAKNVCAQGDDGTYPGYWFRSFGSTENYGGNLGIGLDPWGEIMLNNMEGVISTHLGSWSVILDNGYGSIGCQSVFPFDTVDDLTLATKYTTKTVTLKGAEKTVIDPESLPLLQIDSKPQFFDLGKMNGFLLGCIKALVSRVEALENQLKSNQTAA